MQGVQWERVALRTHWLTWPRRGSRRWLCALRQRSHDWKVWPRKHHCLRSLLPAGSWDGQASVPSGANFFFYLNFRLFWLFRVQYEVHGVQSFPCVVWYSKEAITEMDKRCIYLKHKTIKECTTVKAELFQSKLILHSYCLNFFSGSFICCYEYHTCTNLKENADGPCLCG